ncbi:MAG: efflux RND transporter periplasmic adaptor subunit [Bacteroidaceae bacterium]
MQYVKTTVAEGIGQESMISYPGKTKASETVNPSFKVSGTISRVYVKEGDYVKKGQLLAEIDPHDYEVQLSATEAEYAQIKADAERVISMYNEGTATAPNYDKARYGIQQIEQKLSHHRDQVSYCRLYSPMTGYVQNKLHDGGENVSAGMPIMTLFTSSNTEIEIFIPASDYSRRSQMTRAICSFDVMPDNIYPLDISRMSKEANASQLYMIRFSFKPGADVSRITPGMSTMVYVSYSKDGEAGSVRIPSSCVIRKKDQSLVFVYDKTTHCVSPRAVTTGQLDTRGNIEVLSGLTAGETVVSAGVRFLKPGQRVIEADKTTPSNVGKLL